MTPAATVPDVARLAAVRAAASTPSQPTIAAPAGRGAARVRGVLTTVLVIAVHALVLGALWMSGGPAAPSVLIPAQVILESVEPVSEPSPPAPVRTLPAPQTPPPLQPARPQPREAAATSAPPSSPEPTPVPVAIDTALPTAATAAAAAPARADTGPPPPAVSMTATLPSPARPRIELPSSDADVLNNPRPAYPRLSRRLGEQGTVVVRVLIGTDGRAEQTELRTSSGFERLDQSALETVRRWRFVPGTRNGVPEAMWFNVPIHFVLEPGS